jgi:hypothetical protein
LSLSVIFRYMVSETATLGDRMAIGCAAFTIIIVTRTDGAHHSSLPVALLAPVLLPMRRIRIGRLPRALRRGKMKVGSRRACA